MYKGTMYNVQINEKMVNDQMVNDLFFRFMSEGVCTPQGV